MEFTTHFELHSQAARLFESAPDCDRPRARTGFSPSLMPCSKELIPGSAQGDSFSRLQFGAPRGRANFQAELLPVHSPLL